LAAAGQQRDRARSAISNSRIVDPAMRYLIVTARAAETRQGLGGAQAE